jgi:hypothetical protein
MIHVSCCPGKRPLSRERRRGVQECIPGVEKVEYTQTSSLSKVNALIIESQQLV